MKCPSCSEGVQAEWSNCPFCGTDLPKTVLCAQCDFSLQPDWMACPVCGTPVGTSRPPSGLSVQDSTVQSLQQIDTLNIGGLGSDDPAPRDYCVVCHTSLPDNHFRCPECDELACITCRSSKGNCLNCRRVPSQARELTASAEGPDVTVDWLVPERSGNLPIESYDVVCVELGEKYATSGDSRSIAIRDLPGGESYTFTVLAHNTVGEGVRSEPTSPVLIEPVPGRPENVRVSLNNFEILVAWDSPSSDGGSRVLSYSLAGVGPDPISLEVGLVTEFCLSDIKPGAYEFSVTAENENGSGQKSVFTPPIEYMRFIEMDALAGVVPGTIITAAGTGDSGFSGDGVTLERARFDEPRDVAIDQKGTIYVADTGNHRVQAIDPGSRTVSTVAGTGKRGFSGEGGAATNAMLAGPKGVCVDSFGNLYIADTGNNRVRRVDRSSGVISTVAGNGEGKPKAWDFDHEAGKPALSTGVGSPDGVSVGPNGDLYISPESKGWPFSETSGRNIVLRVLANDGTLWAAAGSSGNEERTFTESLRAAFSGESNIPTYVDLNQPEGVAVDSDNNVFIADKKNRKIRRIDRNTWTIGTFAGTGAEGYEGDGGPAVDAKFTSLEDVTVDRNGNVFVLDGGMDFDSNRRVRKIGSNGIISTVAGNGTKGFSGDGGPATAASIHAKGIAMDRAGNLWIADAGNHRIRVVRGPL